jgi:hypothetical protein
MFVAINGKVAGLLEDWDMASFAAQAEPFPILQDRIADIGRDIFAEESAQLHALSLLTHIVV